MLGIVRPTDRQGLRGGPRRDQSRLDPPYGTLPRSPQPEMRAGAEIVRKKTLLLLCELVCNANRLADLADRFFVVLLDAGIDDKRQPCELPCA